MAVSISGTNGVTFPDSSLQAAAASPYVLKNRIINGAMVIDQRNAGASLTNNGGIQYPVDRYIAYGSAASKFSMQQNAASVTPPAGFTNYLGFTSLAATSLAAGDIYEVLQRIEGYNVADLDFGKSTAKTITLSFWVRSSLTGTFGGALQNSASDRSYVFSYTILAANTWEQKSITITGDTSGTWLTTNGTGLQVIWGLGVGSAYSSTAGSWASAAYYSVTGAQSMVATNGATFYITGVQLEIGTSATPFERRLYNQELANCQRYYQQYLASVNAGAISAYTSSMRADFTTFWPVQFRASPTMTSSGITYSNASAYADNNSNATNWLRYFTCTSSGLAYISGGTIFANAEL